MSGLVYDASAILAVVFDEAGADRVIDLLAQPGGEISAVNWSEVGAKLVERGLDAGRIESELAPLALDVIPFDAAQANVAAKLRLRTRALGLSLGDRCCLALAHAHQTKAVTADAAWLEVKGFDLIAVR